MTSTPQLCRATRDAAAELLTPGIVQPAPLAPLLRELGRVPSNAQHSSASGDHGTPPKLLALERAVMGRIDLDPCSSAKWNMSVGAARYIDEQTNGLVTPWTFGAPRPDEVLLPDQLEAEDGWEMTVHLNPHGDKRGLVPAGMWRALAGYFELGWVSSACWVGFSLEQLSRLQRIGAPFSPIAWPTLIPDERVPYMVTPDKRSSQPTHASFITLLTRSRLEVERFCDLATSLGEVVIPYTRKAQRT